MHLTNIYGTHRHHGSASKSKNKRCHHGAPSLGRETESRGISVAVDELRLPLGSQAESVWGGLQEEVPRAELQTVNRQGMGVGGPRWPGEGGGSGEDRATMKGATNTACPGVESGFYFEARLGRG